MIKYILSIAVVALVFARAAEIELDEGVLVLTESNFESALKDNKHILVEFYAPWCGHCKKLAPEYAKAAQALAEEEVPVKLAKVDATVEKSLGSKFGVKGYPTLKFFIDGSPMDYGGGRNKDAIVSWVKKKSGPVAVTITEAAQLEELQKNEVTVIGFFDAEDNDEASSFLKVAANSDDFPFGICTDAELRKANNLETQGIVLFKKFDEERAELTDQFDYVTIYNFINTKSTPLFGEFTQEASQRLFSVKEIPFLFVAMSKKSDEYEKVEEVFKKVAEENRGKLRAVLLNSDNSEAAQVIKYLDIKPEEYPTYRILNLDKGLKYKPEESGIDGEAVNAFVSSFVSGDLKPFLKSEEVPEDWDAQSVKVLVGKNFKQVALDDEKHVFVEFYAPWCGHCKKLAPIWDELGDKYAGSEDVVIAKMDSTQNEVEEVSIRGFPTLKFFPANSSGKIVDYNGERTLDDLLKFVSKYSAPPAEKKEEAKEETKEETKEEKKKDEL